jgi:hypothetical protein
MEWLEKIINLISRKYLPEVLLYQTFEKVSSESLKYG